MAPAGHGSRVTGRVVDRAASARHCPSRAAHEAGVVGVPAVLVVDGTLARGNPRARRLRAFRTRLAPSRIAARPPRRPDFRSSKGKPRMPFRALTDIEESAKYQRNLRTALGDAAAEV